jgi:hypothetical protein
MTIILEPEIAVKSTTYLYLVNRTRQECGVSGQALLTLQGTLTDESARFRDWIADAWRDLQISRPNWRWMRKSGSFNTTGTATYSASSANAPDLGSWIEDSFRAYKASIGTSDEQFLDKMEWDDWRNYYGYNTQRIMQSRPMNVAIKPNMDIALGPIPDDTYTVVYDYFRTATELVADTDNPCSTNNGLPTRFFLLLIYGAMRSYASHEAAPEVMDRAVREYRRLSDKLDQYHIGRMSQ